MGVFRGIARKIDAMNRWIGEHAAYLLLPLAFITLYEVIARYVFNRPTIWAWDTNVQLLGTIVALVGAYVLLEGQFVVVDIMVTRLSRKTRALLDLITAFLVFFTMSILTWQASDAAWTSWLKREHYTSIWEPPLYPLRFIVLLGFILLFLQVISKFIHDLLILTGKEAAPVIEKGESI